MDINLWNFLIQNSRPRNTQEILTNFRFWNVTAEEGGYWDMAGVACHSSCQLCAKDSPQRRAEGAGKQMSCIWVMRTQSAGNFPLKWVVAGRYSVGVCETFT